jgi:hypothetical protein
MPDRPDASPTTVPARALRSWSLPGWTSWFLVRLAALSGAVWAFEEGPRAFRWPLRFLMPVLAILVLIAFARESMAAVGWVADRFRRFSSTAPVDGRRVSGILERALAWVLVGLVAVHVGMLMTEMSSTSLREDEIGTIGLYSARGPLETVTKYNLAKNHVFFNLLNSVTPGRESYHPLRARIWSFAAVALTLAAAGAWFFRRGEHAEGALVLALLGLNLPQLAISLEARGYGFLLCAASVSALALPGVLAGAGRSGRVGMLAVATVLGSYTMPSYLVFGGAVLLVVWLAAPTRRTFLAGWFAFVALCGLYAPLVSQVAQVAGEYGERYADAFENVKRMEFALRYLVPLEVLRFNDVSLVLGFAILLAAPALLGVHGTVRARAAALLFGLVTGYYAFCLWLQSPPDRVTAFLAGPFAVGAAFLLGEARLRFPRARAAVGVLLTSALCVGGVFAIRGFQYDPPQRWRAVSLFIQALYPEGITVWIPGPYREAHQVHLGPSYPVRTDEIDRGAYARGEWVLHDDRYRMVDRRNIDREFMPAGRLVIPFDVRASETRLLIVPPTPSGVRLETTADGFTARVEGPARSMLLSAPHRWASEVRGLRVECRSPGDARPRRLRPVVEDRFLAVTLPEGEGPWEVSVRFQVKIPPSDSSAPAAWAFPRVPPTGEATPEGLAPKPAASGQAR